MLCVNYKFTQRAITPTNKQTSSSWGEERRVIFFHFDCKHEIFNDFLTLLIPLRSTVTLT